MTQIPESYEQYEYRRRQEVQDDAVAKGEANKLANKARLNARHARFGIHTQLPRTHQELAVVAAEEKSVLGAHVEAPLNIIKESPKNDAVAALIDGQSSSTDAEKQAENGLNDAVIGQKTLDTERVDSRHFCDLGKPFFDDAIPKIDIAIPSSDDDKPCAIPEQAIIEVWLNSADNLYKDGVLTSEILAHGLGLPIDRTNEMKVCHIMQNLGYTKARKAVRGLARQTVWLKD